MQISSSNDTNDNNMKNSSDCAKHLQNTILYHNTDKSNKKRNYSFLNTNW